MPFDWREYCHFALATRDFKHDSFSTEASNRNAVSRIYYAAFCTARNYAYNNGLPKPVSENSRIHGEVPKHFRKDRFKKRVGTLLLDLRGWRNQCDYHDDVCDLDSMLSESENAAKEIFKMLGCPVDES